MKKTFLVTIMIVLSFSVNAQGNFNIGINAALPLGDVKDTDAAAVSVEVNYLFELSNEFKVGPSISVEHYVSDVGNGHGTTFLPISAAARFTASDSFTVGANLGYALGINPEGNDGGFHYRPMVGYNFNEKFMLQATYSGITANGGTFSSFGIGAVFKL